MTSTNKQFFLEKLSEVNPNKKNIIKIAEFLKKNFIHINHPFEYKFYPFEAFNIYKMIKVYGYGNCKHSSILFKFFMDSIGVECSMYFGEYGFTKKNRRQQNHVFNTIKFKKKEYLIDTDFGIIEYKNDLIELQNSLDKETFSHFYLKRKKVFKDLSIEFRKIYDKKIYHKFDITSHLFDYKKKLSQYYSDLYFVQIPYFNKKFKEKKISNDKLMLQNKVVQNKKEYHNLVSFYSTKFKVNDYIFNINNFPYLIINIRVKSNHINSLETFKFSENNIKSNYKFNTYIFNIKKYFSNPIYSFSINSKKKIDYVEIIYQKSSFEKKLTKFLSKITKTSN